MLKTELGRGGKSRQVKHVQIPPNTPPQGFWDDFFSEENFQGETLEEFLNDASPSPTAAKAKLSYFDVPHRELFYKEEDLRCFRRDGTYIGGDVPNKGAEATLEASAGVEAEESRGPYNPRASEGADVPPVSSSTDGGDGDDDGDDDPCAPSRVAVEAGFMDLEKPLGGAGTAAGGGEEEDVEEEDSMGVAVGVAGLGLNGLGAAAFAAASAEYGRSSPLSMSLSPSSPLSSPSAVVGGHSLGGGGVGAPELTAGGGSGAPQARVKGRGRAAAAAFVGRSGGGGGPGGSGGRGRLNDENVPRINIGDNGSMRGSRRQEGVRNSSRLAVRGENCEQQQQRAGKKRRAGAGGGGLEGLDSTGTGTSVGRMRAGAAGAKMKGGEHPAKRRRGVLAPTSSSIGRSVAHAPAAASTSSADDTAVNGSGVKDPMKKKLLQFRQQRNAAGPSQVPANQKAVMRRASSVQNVPVSAAPATRDRSSVDRRRSGAPSARTGGGVISRTKAVSKAGATAPATAAAAIGGRGGPGGRGGAHSAVSASIKRDGDSQGGPLFRLGSTSSVPKESASSKPPTATAAPEQNIVPDAVPQARTRTAPGVVSKPVNTVKRRLGGSIGGGRRAAGASGAGAAALAGVAGRGLKGSVSAAGVKRKAPTSSSGTANATVTDRRRRPGLRQRNANVQSKEDDAGGLSFDDDLKAKLAEHNRGVAKGRHTYEPSKGRVKDWKKWEKKTGKKYYSLNPDEKADANREILAMLAAEKEASEG